MAATPERNSNRADELTGLINKAKPRRAVNEEMGASCTDCKRWVSVVADLALELQAAREILAEHDEDRIHLAAVRSLELYRALVPDGPKPGDPRDCIEFWRAKMRRRLAGFDE